MKGPIPTRSFRRVDFHSSSLLRLAHPLPDYNAFRSTCQFNLSRSTTDPTCSKLDRIVTMPYNNTPITPSKEITGTVALPCKTHTNTDKQWQWH